MRKSVPGFAVLLAGSAVAPNSVFVVSYALRLTRVEL
jgi:hypothetical protein